MQLHRKPKISSPVPNPNPTPKQKERTHLGNDHVLLKSCEPNNTLKHDLLPPKKVLPNNQLQRIPRRKHRSLTALLVAIRFTKDDALLDPQLLIPTPRANPNVLLNDVPIPPIVLRIISDRPTRIRSWIITVLHSRPDEPVGTKRVKIEEGDSERVGIGRSGERVPAVAFVGRVVDFLPFADEVRPIAGVDVLRHCEDRGSFDDFVPRVAFVGRLPNAILSSEGEKSLPNGIQSSAICLPLDERTKERTWDSPKYV